MGSEVRVRSQAGLPSMEGLLALLEATQDGMILMDPEGRVTWGNRAAREIYGVEDPSRMTELVARDILAPEDHGAALETLRLVAEDGESTWIEFSMVGGSDSPIVVSAQVGPIWDAGGELLGFTVLVRDRTATNRTEAALRQSREMLLQVLDTIPVRVFWKDRQSRYLGCNRNLARDAGLDDPEEIVGKTDFDLIFKAHAGQYRADDQEVMESGIPKLHYEEAQTALDGSSLWLRTSKLPMRDHRGEIIGVLGVYEDITAARQAADELERRNQELQKANQELEQLHDVKDELVAMVSHELRTPLVTGIGYLELLLEGRFGDLPALAQERIRIALRSLLRLSSLIQNLLSYQSVIKPGSRAALGLEAVSVAQVVGDCVTELDVRHRQVAHRLEVLVPESLPLVAADQDLFRVVLANLLDNAVHHGGQDARIVVSAVERPQGVEITVSDNGPGIPLDLRAHVFEPFVKSRESHQGSGLGLAIVQGILAAHDSKVVLETEPGVGTTLRFVLAKADVSGQRGAATHRALTPVGGLPAVARIAVVEDDEDTLELLRIALVKRGFLVCVARSVEEALQSVDFTEVDLCLVDLSLPGEDGTALVRCIKARPGLEHLPMLMLTARAEDASRQAAEQAGCDGYLVKPVALDVLVQAIQKRLRCAIS